MILSGLGFKYRFGSVGIRLKAGKSVSKGADPEPTATVEADDWARAEAAVTGRSRWNQMFWK